MSERSIPLEEQIRSTRAHYKWVALALGRPSYPPYAQAGAQDGAVIAIPAAVRRAMHFRRPRAAISAGATQCTIGVLGTSCRGLIDARQLIFDLCARARAVYRIVCVQGASAGVPQCVKAPCTVTLY